MTRLLVQPGYCPDAIILPPGSDRERPNLGNMKVVAQQLIRALRGRRSQVAFARRLGYRANPVTDWEHARRFPTAQETLRMAHRVGVDAAGALGRFAPGITLGGSPGSYELGAWMRSLLGPTRVVEIARRMHRSRPTVSRWLSGTAQPRLHEFLEFVDASTARVPDLVAEIVPIAQVPALAARYEVTRAARRLAFEEPWTEGILRVLETEQYRARSRHDSGWLASVLGLSKSEVAHCLERLVHAEVLRRDQGKYVEVGSLNVDTRGGRDALRALKAHWAKVAMERAPDPHPDDFLAYNVFSASKEDMARIRDVLRSSFREIRAIVAASKPLEEVALVNLHYLDWPVR